MNNSSAAKSSSNLLKIAAATVLTLLVVVALTFHLSARRRINAAARSAREALAARQFVEAKNLIDRWAALAPNDGEPDYVRALLEVETDRPAEALDSIRRAKEHGYPTEPLLILRAVLQSQVGKYDEAEPVLRKAFESSSDPKAEVAQELARIYLRSFRLAESSRVLERWMQVAPDDARPYLWRIEIDQRVNSDPPVLIRSYREALRRDPHLAEARLALADKLRENALPDEALVEYEKILADNPRSIKGHTGAGQTSMLKGNLQAAILHFEEALVLNPKETVALRELGQIDLKYGRHAQACERLKLAVESEPNESTLRYSYARALTLAGDKARAAAETATMERLKKEQKEIADLRENLAKRPDDLDLRGNVARWLIEHGHEKEGLEWTGLILQKQPGHPSTCKFLAEYHARKGNVGLANYYRVAASP
jgi:tetratricopeptide (TPR) repeat protein